MNILTAQKQFSVLILGNGLTGKSVADWCDRNHIRFLIYSDEEKMTLIFYPQ